MCFHTWQVWFRLFSFQTESRFGSCLVWKHFSDFRTEYEELQRAIVITGYRNEEKLATKLFIWNIVQSQYKKSIENTHKNANTFQVFSERMREDMRGRESNDTSHLSMQRRATLLEKVVHWIIKWRIG